MNKTVEVRIRIEPDLKDTAVAILAVNGLTLSTAVRMFLTKVVETKGIPFEVRREPNETSRRALDESKAMRGHARFATAEALFESLDEALNSN